MNEEQRTMAKTIIDQAYVDDIILKFSYHLKQDLRDMLYDCSKGAACLFWTTMGLKANLLVE